MNFPCSICQYIFSGEHLWNIHGNSFDEDRHILCTPCLIKFSHKNAKCPLRCNNSFNPVPLNPGYKNLISLVNEKFMIDNPNDESVPDKDITKNRELWKKLIDNIEDYIHLDFYQDIYGTGPFKNLTCFMNTLKSNEFDENIGQIIKMNDESCLPDNFTVKLGVKRKHIEDQIRQEEQPLLLESGDLRFLLNMSQYN